MRLPLRFVLSIGTVLLSTSCAFVPGYSSSSILFTSAAATSEQQQQQQSFSANTKITSSRPMTATATVEDVQEKPYGSWESPITSKAITAGSVGIGSLTLKDGDLYWLEARPQEAGRNVLCKYSPNDESKSERNAVEVTPKESNVRTRVHEYGGASFVFSDVKNEVYYSDFKTQRVHKLSLDSTVDDDAPGVTLDVENCQYRFADGICDDTNNRLIMIREDHTNPAPKDVVNEIVAVDIDSGEMTVLATGNDFYAAPRLSPDGTKLAYITWNHPNMPWDDTEVRVVTLSDGTCASAKSDTHALIAGSSKKSTSSSEAGDVSIIQPIWHPQTGDLYYISDESGYYNIYRAKLNAEDGTAEFTTNVLPIDYDFGGSAPGWRLGQQGFSFLSDGKLIATYVKDGETKLVVASVPESDDGILADIERYGTEDGLPMQFGGVIGAENGIIYFLGGSPSTPASVYQWNLSTKGDAVKLASSTSLSFADGIISVPRVLEFPTTDDKTAFGYYYPPQNHKYKSPTDSNEAPPLLVKAHGGPTACTGTLFNAGIQYWTSRGFAILDVDYGGSTGYGRDYRRRLRGSWGIVDIDDVCNGALYCVEQGLADRDRLCIDGGSAGGYTTLGALAFKPNVFKAGCSLYGVADLSVLAGDTHKFESRYLDGLVGKYPQEETTYKQRSPIEHVDNLSCPILLLQGDEDKIVPPNQAELMYDALLKKGIRTCLKMYKGEQHGFRKAENIEDALDSELAFYGKVFNIEISNAVDIKIENM